MITQSEIDSVQWYHEFDFGNGLHATSKTPDVQAHRKVWEFINRELDAIDFLGKSVLDIGCWDGFWSFMRKSGERAVCSRPTISPKIGVREKEYISRRRYSDQRSKSIRIFLFMISLSSKENSTLFSASASTTIWSIHSFRLGYCCRCLWDDPVSGPAALNSI